MSPRSRRSRAPRAMGQSFFPWANTLNENPMLTDSAVVDSVLNENPMLTNFAVVDSVDEGLGSGNTTAHLATASLSWMLGDISMYQNGACLSSFLPSPSDVPAPSDLPELSFQAASSYQPAPSDQPVPSFEPAPSFQPGPRYQPAASFQPGPSFLTSSMVQPGPSLQPGPIFQTARHVPTVQATNTAHFQSPAGYLPYPESIQYPPNAGQWFNVTSRSVGEMEALNPDNAFAPGLALPDDANMTEPSSTDLRCQWRGL
ncbi:hypothetical protein AnigIFM56816_007747 [Aspergillus niger]|nr:hypothetical protein AnigIFM56816_007747 [Aspergillus niger]